MIALLRRTGYFLVPLLVLVSLSGIILLFHNKIEVELWINGINSRWADFFFKYFTHLGDGLAALIISLFIMALNIRRGIILLVSFLLAGILIQYLKMHVFEYILRPVSVIPMTSSIHVVEGVRLWDIQSFPSGHSGTAFGILYCLAAFTDNRRLQAGALLAATLLAYSRLYLFQHFLPDVMGGALIGTFISILIIWVFDKYGFLSSLERPLLSKNRVHAQ